MRALYALHGPCFHGRRHGRSGRFWVASFGLRSRSEREQIVHRMPEILFAPEVTFGRLHRSVPQQELNLLQFATAVLPHTFPVLATARKTLPSVILAAIIH